MYLFKFLSGPKYNYPPKSTTLSGACPGASSEQPIHNLYPYMRVYGQHYDYFTLNAHTQITIASTNKLYG